MPVGLALTLTAVVVQSRIGMIGAAFFWNAWLVRRQMHNRFVLTVIAINLLLVATYYLGDRIFARFSLANELWLMRVEDTGRLVMWLWSVQLLPDVPFGVGPGQAVDVLNAGFGTRFRENNIHNVALSWPLELGWIHGGLLVLYVASLALRRLPGIERHAIYFILFCALVQFTGFDAVLWVFLGVVAGDRARQRLRRRRRTRTEVIGSADLARG